MRSRYRCEGLLVRDKVGGAKQMRHGMSFYRLIPQSAQASGTSASDPRKSVRRRSLGIFMIVALALLGYSASVAQADIDLTGRLERIRTTTPVRPGKEVKPQGVLTDIGEWRCTDSYDVVSNAAYYFAIGNCPKGAILDVTSYATENSKHEDSYGGYLGGAYSGCGWIDTLYPLENLNSKEFTGCANPSVPEERFWERRNSGKEDGYYVVNTAPCPEYANYRPWSEANAPAELIRTVPAFESETAASSKPALKWRYVSKYGSSVAPKVKYVMVRDDRIAAGNGEWVFVPRSCLPSTLPENENERIPASVGLLASAPTAAITTSGEEDVWWKGRNEGLWEATYNGKWNPPFEWPNTKPLGSAPAAAITANGEQDVWWQGANGGLYEATYNGKFNLPFEWPNTKPLGSAPTVAITKSGEQDVWWKGATGGLYETTYNGKFNLPFEWPNTKPLGSGPTVAITPQGEQDVWWKGATGGLYETTYNGKFNLPFEWPNTKPLGSGPAADITASGEQDVWWEGATGGLYETTWNGAFHLPYEVPNTKPLGSQPAVALTSNAQFVWWAGANSDLWMAYFNGSWNGPFEPVPGA